MPTKKKFQSEALQYTYEKFIGDDAELNASFEQERSHIEVAKRLYKLRTKAGLSQRELAKRVGTTASAICRLEDADYEGHSLAMLRRIAAALDKRVEIRFVPLKREDVGGTAGKAAAHPRPKARKGAL